MAPFNSRIYTATAALLVSLHLGALPLMPLHARELAHLKGNAKGGKVVYNPPKNVGTPQKSVGGLSRGECKEIRCLMALVPNTETGVEHFPRTISAYPIFFFNAPKFSGEAELRLYELSNSSLPKRIYKTTFPIATEANIMSFRLPKDAPALQIGKFYRWEFSWNNAARSKCVGLVQRVELDRSILPQLEKAKPLEKAEIYAKAGIWFEAVETLAEARRDRPEDSTLMTEWADLLGSVGLNVIALQPIGPASLSTQSSSY